MNFGKGFLGLKAISLCLRSLVFFSVLTLTDSLFGANHLISFISYVTVAGIAIGFGSLDSVALASNRQAARISRTLFLVSLFGIASSLLILFASYWINLSIACLNYGLTFWSLGLLRRKKPIIFEYILNYQMLILWIAYLVLISLETPDLRILSLLYVILNGSVTIIAFCINYNIVHTKTETQENSLRQVSISKLVWEINYSGLTRMPFLLTEVSSSIHSAFGYAYLLFEMVSAILSHYQTIFLKSQIVNPKAWIRLCAVLLAVNTFMLGMLLLAIEFQYIVIKTLDDLVGAQLVWLPNQLISDDVIGLVIFMIAITTFQSVAFGRYALKLEANTRIVFTTSAFTLIAFAASNIFSTNYHFNLLLPLATMLLTGLLLIALIMVSSEKIRIIIYKKGLFNDSHR